MPKPTANYRQPAKKAYSTGNSKLKSALPFTALCSKHIGAFALYAVFCLLILWLIIQGAAGSGYFWQWFRIERVFLLSEDGSFFNSPLCLGLGMTLRIGAVSLLLALGIAILTTALRLAGGPVALALSVSYVQLIRNTPLLVQILFMYFVIAPVTGIESAELSAIIALSLFEGAYMSEIIRAGVLTIPRAQYEAGLSLGLGPVQSAQAVILPQTLRNCMPPLLNECITLIKNTSLASVISVSELTFKGKMAVSSTFMSLEIWLTIAAVYLCLSLFLSFIAMLLRQRLNRGFTVQAP
ncbi:amino acid ABC transporter permease [Desulfovibrio sp. OttesenSCG-928-F07]|nr:amino acid ABC transporter permease [Desulfovibrio sp. OttesenSCG-928-F07]